ncbi:MAG: glycosyltransferase [Candidatus Aminicenantes bacterium]|nr:glycosyltransferase [Candidatus Aminicenantes bacterium]
MEARATVIIPTFGNALFAQWAIKSVQNQTVQDLEICIICDGSPPEMVTFFRKIAEEDPRVQLFTFPKSPRTGEPYRDIVIKKTTGPNIFYCAHDDLWLHNHIEQLEQTLQNHHFTNSFDLYIEAFTKTVSLEKKITEQFLDEKELFSRVASFDFIKRKYKKIIRWGYYLTGLTCGAHTRKAYFDLNEGWITTPMKFIPTDVYMWYKLIFSNRLSFGTTDKVTALRLAQKPRINWSDKKRSQEIKHYYEIINSRNFIKSLNELSLKIDSVPPHRSLKNKPFILRLSEVTGAKIRDVYQENGPRIFAGKLLLYLFENVKALGIRLYCMVRFQRNHDNV